MARINITTTRPEIEIRTTNAKLQMFSRRSSFKIRGSNAGFTASSKNPTFKMDTSQTNAARGAPSPEIASMQRREEGVRDAMNAIGKIASTGTQLGNAARGGNRVAEVAQQLRPQSEVNIASSPQDRPPVEWDMGYLNIEWSPDTNQMEWEGNPKPVVNVSPHSVEITMKQYGSIKITVDEDKIVHLSGKKVDVKL